MSRTASRGAMPRTPPPPTAEPPGRDDASLAGTIRTDATRVDTPRTLPPAPVPGLEPARALPPHLEPGRALADLLPGRVVSRVATEGMWEEALPPEEAACVRDAVPERRREFTAGRAAARSALASLGLGDVVLPADDDRVPVWPSGVVGSISHCDGLCVAAVTDDPAVLGLGLDVEEAEPLPPRLISRVCTPREREWVRLAVAPHAPLELFRVIFTAKEAVYKSCFPRTRREMEFGDVEVTLRPAAGRFVAEIEAPPAPAPAASPDPPSRLEGRFTFADGHILTAVVWDRG